MNTIDQKVVRSKLSALFDEVTAIREDDAHLKSIGAYGSDMSIELWDWSQGVGLYGIWRLYQSTGDKKYIDYLHGWYDRHIAESSVKNINYVAPMLTLVSLFEETKDQRWMPFIREFCEWINTDLPRTQMGGFTHTTATKNNEEQLWVDTLFMGGLFFAKAGLILNQPEYFNEVVYQYLLHVQFLSDPVTGLWRHGWSFKEKHHFAGALWGRGNGWVCSTGIDLIEMMVEETPSAKLIKKNFIRHCHGLLAVQGKNGMWHTLLDDPQSYIESSATAAVAYAFLKGFRINILGVEFEEAGKRAVRALLERISEKGELSDVSSGTPVFSTLEEYRNVAICQRSYGQSLAMLALSEILLHTDLKK
jgi:unsaturated rhamnogalacturonyl hydrolase